MSDLFEPIIGRDPDTIYISNSEIQTFKDCRRKWYLNNYLGLSEKEEIKVGPLPLGTRVHDSLEKYYTDGDNPVQVYNSLAALDRRLFLESGQATDDKVVSKFDSESELGRIMVEGYVEWVEEDNKDVDFEFVSAEKTVQYPVNIYGQDVVLIGKIDLKLRDKMDGSIMITDHKTVAPSAWSNYDKYPHMSEQLMGYITLSRATGDNVDGAMYNLLKKVKRSSTAKPPFYDRKIIRYNRHQLDAYWNRTLSTISDMVDVRRRLDDGESHLTATYPRPSNECSWKCPFFNMCTMMDDGSSYGQYLNDFYSKKNPNERYGDDLPK